MSSNDDNPLSVEEVERALAEIDNKYSSIKTSTKSQIENNLTVLSKEFDSLGLSPIDCSQSVSKIFKQVVSNARCLVQIHRKTLSQMKDVNIDNKYKESKSTELYKAIDDHRLKLTRYEERNSILQNKIIKLTNDQTEVIKRERTLKEELERAKKFYMSKQNELGHQINKLTKENDRLKEIMGKDISTHKSKDDVILKLLKQYKENEEIYKCTIQKLQENNRELLNEILDLKEENKMLLRDNNKPVKAS